MSQPLYPLRFTEIIRNYGFGNRWIVSAFEKTGLPDGQCIAETWEVCDRPNESSRIINGPLAGQTLHDAIEQFGEKFLGRDIVARFGHTFPLLVKFLDATFPLGEQAHPDDELTAACKLDFFGKTEAWYMLRTRPGATARAGNVPGLTKAQLREALLNGTSRECMVEHSVQPGDALLLRAGTMHYSAGGVLFYEVQQNSNVWVGLGPMDPKLTEAEKAKRADDALAAVHLEDGIDCRTSSVVLSRGGIRRAIVVACEHFVLEHLFPRSPWQLPRDERRFVIITQVEGRSKLFCGGHEEVLHAGNTCLIPAGAPMVTFDVVSPGSMLMSYVPDLMQDVVRPLRAAGLPDDAIVATGGRSGKNALNDLVKRA